MASSPVFAGMKPKVTAAILRVSTDLTFDVRSRTPDGPAGRTILGSEPDVIVRGSVPAPYAQNMVNGNTIRAGDMTTVIPAEGLTFLPKIGMKVRFPAPPDPQANGSIAVLEWTVIRVEQYGPGDVVLAWQLQLRN